MFKNLKIIELASVLAGPMVGTFFSELGAEVLKIENKKTGGDVTRKWKLPIEKDSALSAYYASANYKKTSVLLDFGKPEEYQKVLKEIEKSDIVIANFKHGDAKKFGLDYEVLKKINPLVIYGEINGYGSESSRTAFDVVLQAETGFMYMNGSVESGPIKMPVALIDILAAHQLKEGLLCALIKRYKEQKGSYVTVSLYDTAVSSLANQATNWLMSEHIAQPMGTKHPNIAPYGDMFLLKDQKYIVLAIGSDKQFKTLCIELGLEKELLTNPQFIDNKSRVTNREKLNIVLQTKFRNLESESCIQSFIEKNIPAGIVKNMEEVFKNKKAKELILSENIEGQELLKVKTVIFKNK